MPTHGRGLLSIESPGVTPCIEPERHPLEAPTYQPADVSTADCVAGFHGMVSAHVERWNVTKNDASVRTARLAALRSALLAAPRRAARATTRERLAYHSDHARVSMGWSLVTGHGHGHGMVVEWSFRS